MVRSGIRISVGHAAAILGTIAFIAAGTWWSFQAVMISYAAPPRVVSALSETNGNLAPSTPLSVEIRGWDTRFESARLVSSEPDQNGGTSLPLRASSKREGVWDLTTPDGTPLLRPGGKYRLVVEVAQPQPSLPLPRISRVEYQYGFSTEPGPTPDLPSGSVRPRWGEATPLHWNMPLATVSASVAPAVPIRTWVDATDATKTWVQLGGDSWRGLADGQTYQVTLTQARSVGGLEMQHPERFMIAVPVRPALVNPPASPVLLRPGEPIRLNATTNLQTVQVTSDGAYKPTTRVIGRQVFISFPEMNQGDAFQVNVASAVGDQGAPLASPVLLNVRTADALEPPAITPADGAAHILPSSHPAVEFARPIANRDAALQALSITPHVPGKWQWDTPQRIEFIAAAGQLPILTQIAIEVQGGLSGPRTAEGGYLAENVRSVFTTTTYKRIDVSLNRQQLVMMEGTRVVHSIMVATGVAGAPTPPGTYYVQMKAAQMRFRGQNPDGSRYDIPDVHWVMPFWGDYTIHGAYWRSRFGVPGSAGCVSMSDADAKFLYDWTEVGTPVVVHS